MSPLASVMEVKGLFAWVEKLRMNEYNKNIKVKNASD